MLRCDELLFRARLLNDWRKIHLAAQFWFAFRKATFLFHITCLLLIFIWRSKSTLGDALLGHAFLFWALLGVYQHIISIFLWFLTAGDCLQSALRPLSMSQFLPWGLFANFLIGKRWVISRWVQFFHWAIGFHCGLDDVWCWLGPLRGKLDVFHSFFNAAFEQVANAAKFAAADCFVYLAFEGAALQ